VKIRQYFRIKLQGVEYFGASAALHYFIGGELNNASRRIMAPPLIAVPECAGIGTSLLDKRE
jgi:hypothetical protein